MELTLIFFVFALTVTAKSEDLQDYQSLQTEITTYPAALPSKEQNNSSHNSRKASTESLPRLTVALIASPGTDLFHVPHESHQSTPVNAMTATADKVIDSRGDRFVSNQGSVSFTSSGDGASATQLVSKADLALITDVKGEESIVTSTQAGSELVMNSGMMAAAHVSRGREKIAASLHAPLNSKNQRAVESITLLPAQSIAMLSASDPAVIDNLGEATETEERQRKSINENGALKTLGTTKPPLNAIESVFTEGEKTFVQKGSPTIMRLTAVPNKTQLDEEGSDAGVKMVARDPGGVFVKGQSGQKNMTALSLVTHHNSIFDVDIPLPLGLSGQEVVKGISQSTKLLTTKGHASIMTEYTNAVDEKFKESKFSHPLELLFPTTIKPSLTRSLVTSALPPKLLHRIVSAGDKSKGELTSRSTSTGDGQVGMTIYSPSQGLQSTTIKEDEGMLKLVTVLPSKFTERPSVDTPMTMGLSSQEGAVGTSQNIKLLTIKENAVIMMTYSNAVDDKFRNSKSVTRSFITSPLTSKLLQRIVSAKDESEGELTSRSTSTRDGQVGTTIYSPSQSLQSTTIVKGMLKFVTVLPFRFTDRPSVLIKVKNATQPDNGLLTTRQDISSIDSHFFHRSENCCKVSIENRTSHHQGKENDDNISLTDNRIGHFHTLIDKLMPAASSTTQFPVALRVMTISARSKNDSDLAEQSERVVTKLTPSQMIFASNSMHHLVTSDHPDQKIPTTRFQIPPREIQNLSPIFEGHAVTYSPVRQRLIPSLTGRAKPLAFLSSPTGHTPFHPGHVLKGHPLIVTLGNSASPPKLATFQDLKKTQDSTNFQTGNKNTEPTVFQKLLTSHSERLIRTTNTWPVTEKNSFSAKFTSTAGSDKGRTLLPKVSLLSTALQTHQNSNIPTKKLVGNFSIPSRFLAVSHINNKKPQEILPVSSDQTTVFSKLLEVTESSVISVDLDANQMLMTKQPKKDVSHSVSIFVQNKSAGQIDFSGMVSTQSPLKQQLEQNRSAETKGESSTDALVFDQYGKDTFNMQNKNQTPVTVLMENTVSSLQSRCKDLRKTTKGQIDASVSPAAFESFRSTQPLASLAVAETPKMAEQMINQASSLSSTLSSIIHAASNGKDFNSVPPSSYQTIQHEASAITHPEQAASSQAPSSTGALKRYAINSAAVNHLTLNTPQPSTLPAPEPTTGLMRSTVSASGRNMQSTSHLMHLTSSTTSRRLTGFSPTPRASPSISQPHVLPLYNIEDNIIQEDSTQTSLPSVTKATFFAIDHNYGSMASFETTATESHQTGPLQLLETSETSEGYLSTVFPFETGLSKSAEMMSDLPVMQRRMRIASPDFLSGLAQVSDDICGSGNYTAEMRLTLERDIIPGDLVPALSNLHVVINLKTNNTQVNLEIKSCCLSPTITLDEFNTTCCLFSRLPIDPQGIRLLPSVLSKRASFTISLFQMINYSTAYLHCDLSVCLRNNSECERCQQNRNAHFVDEDEIIYSDTGNRISFGPVLKEANLSPFIETTGLDSAEMAAILVSVSGCFLVCVALLLLWTVYTRRLQRSGHCWIPYGCSRNGEHFLP